MDELIAFACAQLDEDERKIAAMEREEHRVRTAPIFRGHPPNWLTSVDIFVSSKRWRDEIEAKRAILNAYAEANHLQQVGWDNDEPSKYEYVAREEALEKCVRLLVQPYAGRAGWREEWSAEPNQA